ncbi:S1/P1 nuclease [Shewanella sp. SR44-4]|jgi:Mor family transcriptional regulator|uniref:S1/P1 nuclease n=1 Tax=Shewanella sp. SR44-4 TaxID=2760935 RepID=UPI001604937E|nr:S1/P1 nuclease [Shewanella sp. SR44-4]MBB1361155.1 S1/P1 nuclease [Shewanella sp. SR44-4]
MKSSVLLNNMLLLVGSVLFTLTFSLPAKAFGQLGHRIVGQIAQANLSPTAQQKINQLTGGESLAQMSTWADEIRSDNAWDRAAPWHYISIEDDESWKTVKRNADGDIIESLQRFEKILVNPKVSQQEKWQALAFYVHFVGDIHQPLHVGHSHDKGGNTIKLKWFGEHTNLHTVWDSKLIEQQQLSFTEYSDFLMRISEQQRKMWSGQSYYQWADESKVLRQRAYQLEQNYQGEDDLRFNYVFTHKPIIEQRLQQAGIRLAEKLNAIFN